MLFSGLILEQVVRMTSEDYRVALTYSNIQSKTLPSIVSGVVSFEDNFQELRDRDLPRKRTLTRRTNSLFAMQTTFDDLSPYLAAHEIAIVKRGPDAFEEIEKAYLKILRILTKTQLWLLLGRTRYVILTSLSSYDRTTKKWSYERAFSNEFLREVEEVIGSREKIVFADWSNRDRLLEVARILARLEYERLRSLEGGYILSSIRKIAKLSFQVLKITWSCPPVEEFSSFEVGPPALVLRRPDHADAQYIYLERGLRVAFTPQVKFCRGSQDQTRILPCKRADADKPFGQFIIGSGLEQCDDCRGHFQCTQCLYRKPLCNGYDAKCGDTEFAGHICCGLFALYVTRFGADLKVGTSIFSNVIGRLLEQGASSALVIYPIEGIMNTYMLEKSVKDFLSERIPIFEKYGIESVHKSSPPRYEILKDFLKSWNRDDSLLWKEVSDTLGEAHLPCDGRVIEIGQANHKVCSFISNYVRPPFSSRNEFLKERPLFAKFDGKVVGYRGSFVFLDSGSVLDVNELQGFVAKGRI